MHSPAMHRLLRSRMRLQHMRLLVIAEQTRNLHQTANELGLTQPAVTKSLQELERLLGVKLFHRSSHGLGETPYTQAATQMARDVLASVERASTAFARLSRRDSRPLTVGGIYAAVPRVITTAVTEFNDLHPEVPAAIVPGMTGDLLRLLAQGEINLAVAVNFGQHDPAEFDCVPIGSDDVVVACSTRHPLLRQAGLTMDDLMAESWIVTSYHARLRDLLRTRREQAGIVPATPDIPSDSWVATLPLLLSGRHVTLLSCEMSRHCIAMGIVGVLPVVPDIPRFEMVVITRAGETQRDPLLAQMVGLIEAQGRRVLGEPRTAAHVAIDAAVALRAVA